MKKVVFFGTPDYAVPALEKLKEESYEISAVVTQPPKPVGRGQAITPSPVAQWAGLHQIKVLDGAPREITEQIKKLNAEVGVLVSYGRILPREILRAFPKGIVNSHPSLLPKYRGPSPVQQTILNGDTETGVSLIILDEQVDHGPILTSKKVLVSPNDTLESLRSRLFDAAAQLMVDTLPQYLEGKIKPTLQGEALRGYTKIIKKADGYIDLANPPEPEKLDRMIRAYYPWPSVWTKYNGKMVKLLPGKKVQLEGKNPVSLKQFLESYPKFPLKEF